jgi:hypothetical protein
MGKQIALISNGDFRDEVCRENWPKQKETLEAVESALRSLGYRYESYPEYDPTRRHGMINTQAQGARIMSQIPPETPVIIVLCSWVYAHHIAGPIATHKGPILLLANFDGTFPGLVSLLNHSATMDRLAIRNSRLWTDGFLKDSLFMDRLKSWCETGQIVYDTSHVVDAARISLPRPARVFGESLAAEIKKAKRILGQLDPGCMGMLNALIDPGKLAAIGMPLELLNQSDLLAEMALVGDREAQDHINWLIGRKATFHWGTDMYEHLVHAQILSQMKMYSAAARLFRRYGLSAIGIPYQYGLVRCCPASDLVEGMLNNSERPEVRDPETHELINPGEPIVHFNEGDVGAGVPQVIMCDIYKKKGMPPETTLHDVRWGGEVSGKFVWVFLISGGAPPAHFGGWQNTHIYRQVKGYFPLGGGTCSGVSKPGIITWARFYDAFGEIGMDCGTGEVVELPKEEVEKRLAATNPQWPIANVHIAGYSRDQLMATHMSNHITIGYGNILSEFVATCLSLGIRTKIVGEAKLSG